SARDIRTRATRRRGRGGVDAKGGVLPVGDQGQPGLAEVIRAEGSPGERAQAARLARGRQVFITPLHGSRRLHAHHGIAYRPMTTDDRDLAGKVFLVTGANTGIGRVTAEALARRGGKVYLACRSVDKARPVLDAIRGAGGSAELLPLDLGSLESVRACTRALLSRDEPLHVLVNNAGLAGARGLTRDGFELVFGTNHLGPFLLTTLLLPRLRASAPARVVNVSSKAHRDAKGIDWGAFQKPTRSITSLREYEVSKLCNVLFTREL